jgi:hypothetical protein
VKEIEDCLYEKYKGQLKKGQKIIVTPIQEKYPDHNKVSFLPAVSREDGLLENVDLFFHAKIK